MGHFLQVSHTLGLQNQNLREKFSLQNGNKYFWTLFANEVNQAMQKGVFVPNWRKSDQYSDLFYLFTNLYCLAKAFFN